MGTDYYIGVALILIGMIWQGIGTIVILYKTIKDKLEKYEYI